MVSTSTTAGTSREQDGYVSVPRAFDLTDLGQPAAQAFRALHLGFIVAPLIAGADKFFNLLTDWTQYLAPIFPNALGMSKQTFMYGVGGVEVLAGVLVALKPRYAGYVVCAWLLGIILNLLLIGSYLDVALRDLGLAIGAFALARLAEAHAQATAQVRERSVHVERAAAPHAAQAA
jgi:hypothetical protein